MLTKLHIRHFKLFDEVEIELGERVVFIGPNNSGKTSALQALALWEIGIKRWLEKYGQEKKYPSKRSGVVINRKDLLNIPVPIAKLLWKNLRVRKGTTDKKRTKNILIEITVEGESEGQAWQCALEFDYANEESFYCRPARKPDGTLSTIPRQIKNIQVSYLPPMSGLAAAETRLDKGAINVRIGEGRTAEVLRNLCYLLHEENHGRWEILKQQINKLFGTSLNPPEYLVERGEIRMSYKSREGTLLDISSSGRGEQQTLLLLAHLLLNRQTVLLLDEPGAHLEILRQRQVYNVLCETAKESQSQIIAASHSEVILNEAADRDLVIAFVGRPHRIDDRSSQVMKALKSIGFEHYYQAEIKGWVLYLEGSTDLAILQTFARKLQHPAAEVLQIPFVHYTGNQPSKAREHFYGLREANKNLVGIAIYDRLNKNLEARENGLTELMWQKNELENYFCTKETLMRYAEAFAQQYGPIFTEIWRNKMKEAITELEKALQIQGKPSPWSNDLKVSDEFLTPLFKNFFAKIGLSNAMQKTDFHVLVNYLPNEQIPEEIKIKLDHILATAQKAEKS